MFNWKKNKNQKYNRKRFEDIVSDKRFNSLETIFKNLQEGRELKDEEIKEAYELFSKSIQTNTISAAELEFVIIASICAYKPHLTKDLLTQPLLMLVWSFGNKITSKTVIEFIEGYILHQKAKPYGGLPSLKAEIWLKEYFRNNRSLVQSKLERVIKQNNEELEII